MSSLENDTPSKDAAQNLLKYLDILYPNGVSINTVTHADRNRYPTYKEEVTMFFGMVSTYATDYEYNLLKTFKITYDTNKIATANWTEIKQMLSSVSRAERLSDYNHARAIEDGRIQRILLRLKQLVEQ
ncbi:unnamed protein product [Adineta steineri]|nr:unnamed protein product [Adineta steineri]CAF3689109.1 unnamed protein product [Adineta steineri]